MLQYAGMWHDTLELLSKRPGGLFAATSYTASEGLREERLLWRWLGGFSLAKSLDSGTVQEDLVLKEGDEEAGKAFGDQEDTSRYLKWSGF